MRYICITSHQCELIKIPTRENNFWDIIASYHSFYTLDLSHFDMIISTKYPSWMIQHDNHVVYMIHPLRGLYDTYHFCNLPIEVPSHLYTGLVEDILKIIYKRRFSNEAITAIFENLRLLKEEEANYNPETFQYPGPFIRYIIHFSIDLHSLRREFKSIARCRRLFAIEMVTSLVV